MLVHLMAVSMTVHLMAASMVLKLLHTHVQYTSIGIGYNGKHGCRCSSLQSYGNPAHHLLTMDCPPYCHLTARKCTPRDEGTITLRNGMVPYKTAPPCLHQAPSIPLRHVYNSDMLFCE